MRVVAWAGVAALAVGGVAAVQLSAAAEDDTTGAATVVQVSRGDDGSQPLNRSLFGAVSADGLVTAFSTASPNLTPGDWNNNVDVFVRAGSGTPRHGSDVGYTVINIVTWERFHYDQRSTA